MTTVLARPCQLCGTTLRPVANRQTKTKSGVLACQHCDNPCGRGVRCPDCTQVTKALRK